MDFAGLRPQRQCLGAPPSRCFLVPYFWVDVAMMSTLKARKLLVPGAFRAGGGAEEVQGPGQEHAQSVSRLLRGDHRSGRLRHAPPVCDVAR
jgi:hypothetical protein